jgi:hypothetical protein
MGDDWVTGVVLAVGAVVAFVAIFLVWQLMQSAYFWIAEKVTGRDVEGEHLDKLIAKDRYKTRKTLGSAPTALYFFATSVGLIWWQAFLLGSAVYVGLHMVGGVSIKWWG